MLNKKINKQTLRNSICLNLKIETINKGKNILETYTEVRPNGKMIEHKKGGEPYVKITFRLYHKKFPMGYQDIEIECYRALRSAMGVMRITQPRMDKIVDKHLKKKVNLKIYRTKKKIDHNDPNNYKIQLIDEDYDYENNNEDYNIVVFNPKILVD